MKSLQIKMAVIAILLVVGSMSISAQASRGTCLKIKACTTLDGTCTTLTAEQQAIIDALRIDFKAEMDVLRTELQSATTLLDKIAIRKEMVDLRNAHLAEVQALLDEWGI
jgi:hypothetical protein